MLRTEKQKIDMSSKNTDFLSSYKTPQEALANLETAAMQVMALQLEIYDALKHHLGYSLTQRLRLRWLKRKYARLANRIDKAMNTIPEFEVPSRHHLIEKAFENAQPTDLKGALDELALMRDGESLIVGPLSRGQRAAVYGRAKKRGFAIKLKAILHGDTELRRICSYDG